MCAPEKNTTECTEGKDAPLAKCGRRRRRRPKTHLLGLVEWAVVIVGVLTFTGFLGRLGWLWELTCHFRVQYFLFLAFSTVLYGLAKRPKTAAATAIVALINLLASRRYYRWRGRRIRRSRHRLRAIRGRAG